MPIGRLRIGYVSGHFKSHAVNFFTEPILAAHDRGQFKAFCYSDVTRPTGVTQRIRGCGVEWRDQYRAEPTGE